MNDRSANMKKILILSYHFPPMNVIASQRALGYANHFKKFGLEPTIVTYDWSKSAKEQYCLPSEFESKIILEENEKYKVYRLPVLRHKRARVLGWMEKSTFLNKIGILSAWLCGHLDTTSLLLDYKLTERKFLNQHLANNKYDVVMGIFSPHFHLSNCKWAHKKKGVKYVFDFRDFWNNEILKNNYSPSLIFRLNDKIAISWWRYWAAQSSVQTMTSKSTLSEIDKVTKGHAIEVRNGFEDSDFLIETQEDSSVFKIIHNGNLYGSQDITIFLQGVRQAIDRREGNKIKVEFIGAKRKAKLNSVVDDLENTLEKFLHKDSFVLTGRIERKKSIANIMTAQLLYFPTFLDSPGIYSGKLFEYLGARKNIIAVPSDNNVVEDLLMSTNSGQVCNTADDVCAFVLGKYDEWLLNGFCKYKGIESEIFKFSRESQSEVFAKEILEKL